MFKKRSNIEKALLSGLKKSDHDCFRKLFDVYGQPLYHFSMNYLKSEEAAEDVVQEAFIKIWDRRKNIDTEKSFQSYIFTIALNSIRKYFNKLTEENQLRHDILKTFFKNDGQFDEKENYQELLDKLDDLIDQMPAKRSIIFREKKLNGRSHKEIAEELNISVKTVEYHITEGMKFLKNEFSKSGTGGMVFFYLFVRQH